ncbi:MAG: hypothetical protein OIF48_07700 [Silicimonas sp.]|jgi:hypothetical protein|nr:hypothetical protein [Silicimonas sp.]
MALGAIMVSMPAALLGSLFLSVLHGLTATESLAAYSAFGATFMMAILIANGMLRD